MIIWYTFYLTAFNKKYIILSFNSRASILPRWSNYHSLLCISYPCIDTGFAKRMIMLIELSVYD